MSSEDLESDLRPELRWRADLELVRSALAEEPLARRALAERLTCVARILSALNGRMGVPLTSHDLEDLTQDVLIAAWGSMHGFEGRSSLDSWVYRTCLRALLARLERRQRMPALAEAPELAARDRVEADDEVLLALERLDARPRRVIELKHFEDLTFEEIGERTGSSTNTIKSWYYRGIEELKRFLASRDEEER